MLPSESISVPSCHQVLGIPHFCHKIFLRVREYQCTKLSRNIQLLGIPKCCHKMLLRDRQVVKEYSALRESKILSARQFWERVNSASGSSGESFQLGR